MRGIFTSFARNSVFANIFLCFILFGGLMAMLTLPRETFPDIHLDMIRVMVVWPGADPAEVEEAISRKIEEAIEGIEGIKTYNTISNEHVGMAIIEVSAGYDLELVKNDVRDAVDTITTFPPDAENPVVEEFLLRIMVMLLALTGPDLTDPELQDYAQKIKDDLLALPGITQVELSQRDREITIEVSEEKLREYGITFEQVAQVVKANSMNVPGGTIRTKGEEIRLRTMGRNYTAEDFGNIVVLSRPEGYHITLDRIATIRDGFFDDNVVAKFNGKDTTIINIFKTENEDTLAIDREVLAYCERKNRELPDGMKVEPWARFAPLLNNRINLLLRNGISGLIVVFILLWLYLDIRLSFWVSMGIPVSLMGALMTMWWFDATINMISLFGMVMVLGIIVDDATVLGEAVYVARKKGMPPVKAAVDGVMEVGLPVVAAVTTTIVAFLPMFYVGGFVGRLINVLPMVVIAALIVSLLECLFMFPAHLSHLPDPNIQEKGKGLFKRMGLIFHRYTNQGLEYFVAKYYDPFIGLMLRWRYVGVSAFLFVLFVTWGIYESGVVKFEFFPEMDGNSMAAVVEFPSGTPLEATEKAVAQIEQAAKNLEAKTTTASGAPLLNNTFSLTGAYLDERGQTELGTHFGTVRVELLDSVDRNVHIEELMAAWEREIGQINGMRSLSIRGDETGPPGKPIEVWMQGENLETLVAAANEFKEKLATYDGVYQIKDDFRRGKKEIHLQLKPEARALGLHVADLAHQVFTGYYGEELMRVQRDENNLRIRICYPEEERRQLAKLEDIRIRPSMMAMSGEAQRSAAPKPKQGGIDAALPPRTPEVPLRSVADLEYMSGVSSIRRTDGQRRVSVTAEVESSRANTGEIIRELEQQYFNILKRKYPDITMTFEGEQQEFRDAMDSLYIGFPLAIIAIFVIVATTFRSYIQPLVILLTVPFGMCGAVFGHLVFGYNFSMLSVLGLVALAGVVVNDAIVLIECANSYLANGESFFEAVRKAGSRRFRAIFLTTITTAGGLTPLMLEKDFQAKVLIPMAISLVGGVIFASLITLLLVPCVLCILNDARRAIHWLFNGVMPTPESVEPARFRNVDIDHL